MPQEPKKVRGFNRKAAHRAFSAELFNAAWALIDKPSRTAEENEQMVRLTMASHYHWTQRPDYTPTSVAIAHWQTSRVYALIGQAANARRYGELTLQASQAEGVEPFYTAMAHEALARAAAVAGDRSGMEAHLAEARHWGAQVAEDEDRQVVEADLATVSIK